MCEPGTNFISKPRSSNTRRTVLNVGCDIGTPREVEIGGHASAVVIGSLRAMSASCHSSFSRLRLRLRHFPITLSDAILCRLSCPCQSRLRRGETWPPTPVVLLVQSPPGQ